MPVIPRVPVRVPDQERLAIRSRAWHFDLEGHWLVGARVFAPDHLHQDTLSVLRSLCENVAGIDSVMQWRRKQQQRSTTAE